MLKLISWTRSEKYLVRGKPLHEPIENCSLGRLFYECLRNHYRNASVSMHDVGTDESVTFQDLFALSCKLAVWLREQGVQQGDVVLIYSPNRWEYVVPVLAAFYNCHVVANASSLYTQLELTRAIELVRPKIVFGTYAAMDTLESLKSLMLDMPMYQVVFLDGLCGLLATMQMDLSSFQPKECNVSKQTAVILFSADPSSAHLRGVMLTHENYLTRFAQSEDPDLAPTTSGNLLLFLPFSHAFAFALVLSYLLRGQCVHYMARFSASLLLTAIEKHSISLLPVAPPIMGLLAKHANITAYNLSSVKHVLNIGLPLRSNIAEASGRIFPKASVCQGYGLPESTFLITSSTIADLGRKPGSSGTAMPGVRLIIRDAASGRSLGPYEVGELCVKSGTVMKGYIRDARATRARFTFKRWLRTGDMAYYDEDLHFYIVRHRKEPIKW